MKLFLGALIDIERKTLMYGVNTTLDVEDLERWESNHGSFKKGTVLLVKFGWSKFWPNRSLYLGADENGGLHFPGKISANYFPGTILFFDRCV